MECEWEEKSYVKSQKCKKMQNCSSDDKIDIHTYTDTQCHTQTHTPYAHTNSVYVRKIHMKNGEGDISIEEKTTKVIA